MDLTYDKQRSSRRLIGFVAVLALHIFIFYALVTGLGNYLKISDFP